MKFLGHVVSQEGIAVDPSKIEAMMNEERLTLVIEIRNFLGLLDIIVDSLKDFPTCPYP